MLLFLEIVNIIAILLMLFMLRVILLQQPSKAQTAFILYNLFTIMFVIGIHLELIHSNTVGEALAGLCVQYVGQSGLLMSLLWFVSEFARFPIPVWIYRLEAVCYVFVTSFHKFVCCGICDSDPVCCKVSGEYACAEKKDCIYCSRNRRISRYAAPEDCRGVWKI